MYTRSYQIKKEPPKPCCEEAELPVIEETPKLCEEVPEADTQPKKRRYRAIRVPVLKECQTECDEPCETEKSETERDECISEAHVCKERERSGILRSFTHDELFILALIVLLLSEGCDDILILALCFIIA